MYNWMSHNMGKRTDKSFFKKKVKEVLGMSIGTVIISSPK